MAQFLGGAVDCGPSTVLKSVSGRVDRDFSLQQDRLISVPNVPGPSRQIERSSQGRPQNSTFSQTPRPFDLTALKQHLSPQVPSTVQSNWARGFTPQHSLAPQRQHPGVAPPWHEEFRASGPSRLESPNVAPAVQAKPFHQTGYLPRSWQPSYPPPVTYPQQYPHSQHVHFQPPVPFPPASQVEAFPPHTATTAISSSAPAPPLTGAHAILSQTARHFTDDLGSSDIFINNPKLAQSQFLELLRAVGEEKVVVKEGLPAEGLDEIGEGGKFVERSTTGWAGEFLESSNTASSSTAPSRLSHQAMENGQTQASVPESSREWGAQYPDQEAITQRGLSSKNVHFEDTESAYSRGVPSTLMDALSSATSVPGQQKSWEETDVVDSLDIDEEAFFTFNGPRQQARSHTIGVGDIEGWGEMQRSLESLETQAQSGLGKRAQDHYLFQAQNPYSSRSTHILDSPTLKGVLELEAAVQEDPTNHEAWYSLGLKQQENEREDQAIMALSKVVQLEPDYKAAYLALAVSYTNEGELETAYHMLAKWAALNTGQSALATEDTVDREKLVNTFLQLANLKPNEVDADVQIALGVLFNASEEYGKAEDCFLAALSVRPDDWLLYNRLGATLANGGNSNKAIGYYHEALSLHPNFVRALFNIGISYFNIGEYAVSAQCILDALRLQEADSIEGYTFTQRQNLKPAARKGVGNDALWMSLRNACLHMGRADLVALISHRDLGGFPMDVVASEQAETSS
ncbi:hypothetical protein M231_06165 [Tremella mesenterica]|uniref:Uncharacterized protein n=1 Tax=Tremella mesenterica TaxID=5217 RepID=A0A4Q1BFE7_TREME|nr:hypothetical protein M231_06165 [Tremella mesenterica]